MWLILLEAGLALLLLALMVWTTWPKRSRRGRTRRGDSDEHDYE